MNTVTDIVVLASGKGSRMGYKTAKPLLKIKGKSFIQHILDRLNQIDGVDNITITESSDKSISKSKPVSTNPVRYIIQPKPNGPAAALQLVLYQPSIAQNLVVLLGDSPLFDAAEISKFIKYHSSSDNILTLMVTESKSNLDAGKITYKDGKYIFYEPSKNSIKSNTYSLGPIAFQYKYIQDNYEELISNQKGQEKRIEPIIELLQNKGLKVGLYKVKVQNFELWNINSRNDLKKARKLASNLLF